MMNLILSGLTLTEQGNRKMKITKFNKMVDELTNAILYSVIELMPTECKKCST